MKRLIYTYLVLIISFNHVFSQSYWNQNVIVTGDGVMEVGKYIDFHGTNNDPSDYSVRLFYSPSDDEFVISKASKITGQLFIESSSALTIPMRIRQGSVLGQSAGDFQQMYTFEAAAEGNNVYQNQWILRDADGPFWTTSRIHNGISVDRYFNSPGINTKTWWERDPNNNLQIWGNAGETYMTLRTGNLGIGTISPSHKLDVNGTIHAKEVLVDLNFPGPDYVFEEDYPLSSLSEIESYIKENKHLPEVPSAAQMKEEGVNVIEMQMLLLKKIEELTLQIIDLEKRINTLENE